MNPSKLIKNMNPSKINEELKKRGLTHVIVTKIRKCKEFDFGHLCVAYYIYDVNQDPFITERFKIKNPRIRQYNNLLFISPSSIFKRYTT